MNPQPSLGAPAVRFGILGSLRIEADGREVALESPTQRRLLGALLVNLGEVVSRDRLAEILWGDDQPADPLGNLHTHVSRLRAALERHGGAQARDVVLTRPEGYTLAVQPDQVDACRFERLIGEARAVSVPQASADLIGEALELRRGPPLFEFDHEQATIEATRLEELWRAAVELRADALLRLGRYQEVAAELEAPVARHPLAERLRGQLIVARYRCGRQADALAAYRDLRDELVGELGVEPSAALRRLEAAILRQADDLPWPAPPAAGEVASGRPGEARQDAGVARSVLGDELNSFVGRAEDTQGISAALAARRIVVLTGVGGVGKSRLARRIARDRAEAYPDGVVVCDLVGADQSEVVADVLATALGVLPARRGGTGEGLVAFLQGKRLLLVIDNCEHVAAGVTELVDLIGRRCPEVDVLATSRQPLGVTGQQIWPVGPLGVGEGVESAAVALFCDRAAEADPSFEPADADQGAVVEICRRLDGLPLAIELAAALTRSMTPADIAERLDRRFDMLTAAAAVTSPRHRSLQRVLEWSYEQLPAPSRRLFDRLAVFAGGFDLDAAGLVCSGEGVAAHEVPSGVAELVDHSLVAVDRSGRHARYRLLESLRAYGESKLHERGEVQVWRRRHAEHFTALAERAAAGLVGPDEASWVRVIDTELGNLRAAQSWACASEHVDLALRLPASLRNYAYHRLTDEVCGWALRALELPGASTHAAQPAARIAAAVGHLQRGALDLANAAGQHVLAGDSEEWARLRAHQLLTEIALYQGRLDETDQRGRQLIQWARALGAPDQESLGHLYRVHAAAYSGRTGDATTHLEAGWRVVASTANPTLRAAYSYLEGEIRLDHEPGAARPALSQAIEIAGSVRNRFVAGIARVALAALEARHGEPREALEAFREIIDHWRGCGDWIHMWTTLHNFVVLLERVGAHDPAAVLHGAVKTAATGAPAFGPNAQRLEVAAAAVRGSLGEQAFVAADTRGRAMADEEVVAFALEEIDRLLARRPAGEC